MITARDEKIVLFINTFGKTFYEVLGRTFFNSEQVARNRVNLLIKRKILKRIETGIGSPHSAIVLGAEGKSFLISQGVDVKGYKITQNVRHNLAEQIVFFHLSALSGSVEKTSVATHSKKFEHTPDFLYFPSPEKMIFIEVETSLKSPNRYTDIARKIDKTKPHGVVYIGESLRTMETLMKHIPNEYRRVYSYIDLDTFIENVQSTNKINPIQAPYTETLIIERETPKEEKVEEIPAEMKSEQIEPLKERTETLIIERETPKEEKVEEIPAEMKQEPYKRFKRLQKIDYLIYGAIVLLIYFALTK